MPNIENNTMSTFTIGGKTFEIKDASARSNIQTINTVLDTKANSSNVTAIDTRVTASEDSIGDLSQLTTTAKDSLVSAVTEINGRLALQQDGIDKLNEEMGVSVPDEYSVTTEGANVAVNIAEHLSFDLGTAYKFKFSISEPQITATYFWFYRDAEHQLFSMTIPAGQTSNERNYTTSATTAVTDGYITMKVNVANVSGTVEISNVVDPPTRIDTIEALGIETKAEADGNKAEISQISVSLNKLNPLTITDGKYINKTGQTGNDITLFYTDFIPVKQGDRVNIVYDGVNSNAVRFRWLTAYDSQKNVLSELGWESSWAYNVPEGVSFVRTTLYKTNLDGGKLAININAVYPYSAYGDAVPALENVYNVLNSPYTTLPDYVLGGAWYKPLGSLEKGYFCMVTDDGRIGMNEYTIPMVLAKDCISC